jgi:hypothetical protein
MAFTPKKHSPSSPPWDGRRIVPTYGRTFSESVGRGGNGQPPGCLDGDLKRIQAGRRNKAAEKALEMDRQRFAEKRWANSKRGTWLSESGK